MGLLICIYNLQAMKYIVTWQDLVFLVDAIFLFYFLLLSKFKVNNIISLIFFQSYCVMNCYSMGFQSCLVNYLDSYVYWFQSLLLLWFHADWQQLWKWNKLICIWYPFLVSHALSLKMIYFLYVWNYLFIKTIFIHFPPGAK